MALLTPPPAAPQRGDRTTFANRVDAFITWLINFVSELVTLVTNLNTLAAGGAYSLPYIYDGSGTTEIDPGPGKLRLNNSAQSQSTAIYLDILSAAGNNVSGIIDTFNNSTSAKKGTLRIQKVGNPALWMMFNFVMSYTSTGYRALSVTPIGNYGSPFVDGDAIMLFFDGTGDKGDTGAAAISQSVKFSDRKTSGAAGGTATGNTITQTRTINTTEYNTIPSGVSLASNQMTVPAGTYDISGRAPAQAVGAHKAFLYNVTDSSYALIGSSTYSGSGAGSTASDSIFSGRITLAAAKTFAVRHYTSSSGATSDLGVQAGASGQSEVYTEVEFIKVG